MTRLTRSQVQDRNRETVLEVARGAFLRDGYVATSLASVAKEAGFTTGIVYSSFGSKADLALSVLERLQAEQISALGERVGSGASSDVLDRVRQWAAEAMSSGWVRLELELLLDTMNDPRLAAAQTRRQTASIQQAVTVVRSLVPPDSMDDETIEVLAEAAVDYAIGLAMRQSVNPDATPDRFLRLIEPLVAAITPQG
ncbi:TetR/AcrR family transcriptional regulator [Aeromicrobium ginsengisoli]|uniref:TetR/AcrR family transcriptional regulator n=1 Tax=Aeromicrobium ginsengisoli TaxID=363867 RepID=A0A5M4FJF6_9ACTN|nr:TetR/AcrR family transcriptional regulator [Aeromicrobium ginsengisoli]KAA1400191.1 TetR/AcrR family transcriptional regulator [Aeromicrobium ginsengisoli]